MDQSFPNQIMEHLQRPRLDRRGIVAPVEILDRSESEPKAQMVLAGKLENLLMRFL